MCTCGLELRDLQQVYAVVSLSLYEAVYARSDVLRALTESTVLHCFDFCCIVTGTVMHGSEMQLRLIGCFSF
jgi:hypothetical protein